MSQPSGENKRGRKPADSWTWKDDSDKEYKVAVTVKEPAEYNEETRKKALETGLRMIARQSFTQYMSETIPAIVVNLKMRDELVKAFKPTEKQLNDFMKGKAVEVPTEWTFEG